MRQEIIGAANGLIKKYYLNPAFQELPKEIQDEIKLICVTMAEKLQCTFLVAIDEQGNALFQIAPQEGDIGFDQIGAELEIKRLQREKKELYGALELWYKIFKTDEGKEIRDTLHGERK